MPESSWHLDFINYIWLGLFSVLFVGLITYHIVDKIKYKN